MGLQQYSVAIVSIALFTIAIIGFAINFAEDNDAPIDISGEEDIISLSTKTEGNVSSFSGGSESTYQSIVESSIDEGETTPSGGQFAITPFSLIKVITNILQVGYIRIFGTGSGFGIFLTTLISIIGFTFGLLIWKAWAGRMPD